MNLKLKTGQIQTQIFIYIVAILIVGMILMFGYSAVKQLGDKADQASMAEFKTVAESNFKTVASNFGRVKTFNAGLPSGFKEICFVSLRTMTPADISTFTQPGYPIIEENVRSNTGSNMFLVSGLEIEPFFVGEIVTDTAAPFGKRDSSDDDFLCVEALQGTAKLRLYGKGDHLLVGRG